MKHFSQNFVTIERSKLTPNFLILIDGLCYDSTIKYSDAVVVKDFLNKRLRKHPLTVRSKESLAKWISLHATDAPVFDSWIIDGEKPIEQGGELSLVKYSEFSEDSLILGVV